MAATGFDQDPIQIILKGHYNATFSKLNLKAKECTRRSQYDTNSEVESLVHHNAFPKLLNAVAIVLSLALFFGLVPGE
jgi:hypothetical protein